MAKSKFKRISFLHPYAAGAFPVIDLRFGDVTDNNFSQLERAQHNWQLEEDGYKIGDLYIESSIDNARVTFMDTLQDFADADETEQKIYAMEALLYRNMLLWDNRPCEEKDIHKKVDFLNSLDIFLRRQSSTSNKAIRQNGATIFEITPETELLQDHLSVSTRKLALENSKSLTGDLRNSITLANQQLDVAFQEKNNPKYNHATGTVIDRFVDDNKIYAKTSASKIPAQNRYNL